MDQEELRARFIFYNPWWRQNAVPEVLVPTFRRHVFGQLIRYLDLERMIILKGPRRTGKSTLIYQLIDHLLRQGVKPANILYLNFEDPLIRQDLHRLLAVFEKLLGQRLDQGDTTYIFLDEIHLLPQWADAVKSFFDKKYPIKFICSGSAASLIQKGGESLAGRTVEETILPFSFREWVAYHVQKSEALADINRQNYVLFQNQIEMLWETYLARGGFAHILDIEEPPLLRKLIYEDVVQKVIYKDLVDVYGIREPLVLEKVFYYLIQISGQLLNLTDLSVAVGLNRQTLRSYLSYLRQAFLYFELPKFSRSVKQSLGSAVKIHLVDPAFSLLVPQPKPSFLWETVVAGYFYQKYPGRIFYWREKQEVDLIWQTDHGLVPIEIKTGANPRQKELKGMFKFLERFGGDEGWVVYPGQEKELEIDGKTIRFINAPKYLYLDSVST